LRATNPALKAGLLSVAPLDETIFLLRGALGRPPQIFHFLFQIARSAETRYAIPARTEIICTFALVIAAMEDRTPLNLEAQHEMHPFKPERLLMLFLSTPRRRRCMWI